MNHISKLLRDHYRQTFLTHGATVKGVDWGDKTWAAELRQLKMLQVIDQQSVGKKSLLDVGCGYGDLATIIRRENIDIEYAGIDIVPEMVLVAQENHPQSHFTCGDVLESSLGPYDYVVCNGILTQKTTATTLEMNHYAQQLIRRLFEMCRIGAAFNLMTTYVNFQRDNLYYRNPAEILAWCMSELTPHARIDCAYELWYEYTVYLYKPTCYSK